MTTPNNPVCPSYPGARKSPTSQVKVSSSSHALNTPCPKYLPKWKDLI